MDHMHKMVCSSGADAVNIFGMGGGQVRTHEGGRIGLLQRERSKLLMLILSLALVLNARVETSALLISAFITCNSCNQTYAAPSTAPLHLRNRAKAAPHPHRSFF